MSTFTISLISVFFVHAGVCAQEVHLCGEASAIELVREFAHTVGDDFEVRRYKRLTPLTVMDKAIGMSLYTYLAHLVTSNAFLLDYIRHKVG